MTDVRENVARAICEAIDADPDVENAATLVACRTAADAALAACGYAEMQAEIERLRALVEWRPIETAPKDGTFLLLFDPHNDRTITVGFWSTQGLGPEWARWVSIPGAFGRKPTHWLPLPPPPRDKT